MSVTPHRPEVLAFLEAIKESPEDDTSRLILADWLDEYGDESDQTRAELIRLQCRLASMERSDPQAGELRQRADELLDEYRSAWLGPLQPLLRQAKFTRGLAVVEIPAEKLLPVADEAQTWAEAWAWVEKVRLTWNPGELQRMVCCPVLRRITFLDLWRSEIGSEKVGLLAGSPHVSGMLGLDLGYNSIDLEGIEILSASPHFARLNHLSLNSNHFGEPGGTTLAVAPFLAQLRFLNLSHNALGDKTAKALATVPSTFTSLCLGWNQLDDKGAQALAASPFLASLTRLDLHRNQIGPWGARALLASPYLAQLKVLNLAENPLGPAAEAIEQRFGKMS